MARSRDAENQRDRPFPDSNSTDPDYQEPVRCPRRTGAGPAGGGADRRRRDGPVRLVQPTRPAERLAVLCLAAPAGRSGHPAPRWAETSDRVGAPRGQDPRRVGAPRGRDPRRGRRTDAGIGLGRSGRRAQYEECSVAASPEGSRRPTVRRVPPPRRRAALMTGQVPTGQVSPGRQIPSPASQVLPPLASQAALAPARVRRSAALGARRRPGWT